MLKEDNLTSKTKQGLKWNSLNVLGQTLLNFFIMVLMARLLTPGEFGLLTLTMIFVGLAEKFSTMGVGPYLIQKDNLFKVHIKSAFTIALGLGVSIYILLYLISPVISVILKETAINELLPVVSIIFLFQCILAVNQSLLIREMQFKSLFVVEILSTFIGKGIVPIYLAIQGWGVWSLVIGMITYTVIKTVLLQLIVKAPLSLRFDLNEYKDIFWFGGGVTSLGLLNYIANNIDNFFIGRYLGLTQVGLYNRSSQLMKLPLTKISQTLSNVLFSSYSRYQNNFLKLESSYLSAISNVSLITFPVLVGMIIGADYIIVGLYGEKWSEAILIFQILCLSGFFKVIFNIAGAITKATRNVYAEAKKQLIYMLLITLGSFIGVAFGVEFVALAVVISSLYMYIAMNRLCIKILNSSWKKVLIAQYPGISVSLLFFIQIIVVKKVIEFYFIDMYPTIKLILFIIICIIALLISILIHPNRLLKSEELKKIKGKVVKSTNLLNKKLGEKNV